MAIAGRVAIVPKGEYSNAVTYDKLDLVMFNNDAYVAKKASTGIEPTNDEYWMLILNNVVAEDLEKIINGTTTVGNANKLGDKDASEYALAEQIKNNSIWTQLTIGFDLNNALGKYRTHSGAITTTLLNLPPTSLQMSGCEILLYWLPANDTNVYGIQIVILSFNGKKEIWVRHKAGANSFGEWEELATTADLANYLPLSGGRLQGGYTPLIVNNTSATGGTVIGFQDGGVSKGFLGIQGNIPIFLTTEGAYNTLLHTGNKPTGTYTGNGDATQRQIQTGGVGSAVVVWGNGGMFIATPSGILGGTNGGSNTANYGAGNFTNGVLTIGSDSAILNANGVTYYYQVL